MDIASLAIGMLVTFVVIGIVVAVKTIKTLVNELAQTKELSEAVERAINDIYSHRIDEIYNDIHKTEEKCIKESNKIDDIYSHRIDEIYNDIRKTEENCIKEIEDVVKNNKISYEATLRASNAYTDSRFDKLTEKIKK